MKKDSGKRLRSGFTTGAAAAAATKAALQLLLSGQSPKVVAITFLTGASTTIPVHRCEKTGDMAARCTIVKDAGDDPDITHGAEIGVTVTLEENTGDETITITGGTGVGVVTKPGLEIPIGQAAITSGPISMINNSVKEILADHPTKEKIHIEVFVPKGKLLAQKTLNARLGIVGGISILGTTGIVRPLSHGAYVATIERAMDVARAMGSSHLVLTTGRRSERFAQNRWPQLSEECFVQMGDFFEVAMSAAADRGFESATLAVFFGKAVKMAQNIPHTHAAKSEMCLRVLADWALAITKDRNLANRIAAANTARHAFDPLKTLAMPVIARVADQARSSALGFAKNALAVRCVIFDYDGTTVVDTKTDCG